MNIIILLPFKDKGRYFSKNEQYPASGPFTETVGCGPCGGIPMARAYYNFIADGTTYKALASWVGVVPEGGLADPDLFSTKEPTSVLVDATDSFLGNYDPGNSPQSRDAALAQMRAATVIDLRRGRT